MTEVHSIAGHPRGIMLQIIAIRLSLKHHWNLDMDVEQVLPSTAAQDTQVAIKNESSGDYDENAIDFDGPKDPANPLNWSAIYKWSIVALVSVMSLVV